MKKSKQTEENTVFELLKCMLLQEVKVFAMLKIM